MQRKEKGEVSVEDISKDDAAFILWQGDITRLQVDAIVNAATVRCWDVSNLYIAASIMSSILLQVFSCVIFATE